MKSHQFLPQELLDIIVSLTLEPWPAHAGSFYNAALASRLENPFLLVSKQCRQIILNDLAETLWLRLEWYGPHYPTYKVNPFGLRPPPDVASIGHGVLSGSHPIVNLVVNDKGWTPDSSPTIWTAPFNYQDFACIVDKVLQLDLKLDLSTSDLTYKTSQVVDQLIKPLLPFLLGRQAKKWDEGRDWDVKILGEHIRPSTARWHYLDFLEHAMLGYREYRRLKSMSLHAIADAFALQADAHLNNTYARHFGSESLYLAQGLEGLIFQPTSRAAKVPDFQCKKIMLEFAILATSTARHLFRTDPGWQQKRASFTFLSTNASTAWMYLGLSDLDLARWYHANGLLHSTRGALRGKFYGQSIGCVEPGPNYLAVATAMFPENAGWRRDLDESIYSLRDRFGNKWNFERDRRIRVERTTYIDSEGKQQELIGAIKLNDTRPDWEEILKHLPMLQKFGEQCVKDLEGELGIENGDWQMG